MSEFIIGLAEGLAIVALCFALTWLTDYMERRRQDKMRAD